MIRTAMKLPANLTGAFVYVDCGSQGDQSNPLLKAFPDSRYIGFDPTLTATLVDANQKSISFPTAIGKQSQTMEFHRTQNPNCSSFFTPNQPFLDRFVEIGPFFKIVENLPIKIVALDEFLPDNGVNDIDFLELDTQGSELDILYGAKTFLSNGVLGIRVEVEFSEMYRSQPLFSDIDAYLRALGFILFDLERYHVRRKSSAVQIQSREQILWGQALYFRDYLSFPPDFLSIKQKLIKLAVIASYYGFHSYAAEINEFLLQDPKLLSSTEKSILNGARASYISYLKDDRPTWLIRHLIHTPFKRILNNWFSSNQKWQQAYLRAIQSQNYFWKD